MKNVIANTKLFLMALSALFILSCSPEDGTDGAIGPQGPAGVDGADGIDGADGQDGAIGPQGIQGEQGIAGQNGTNGIDGTDGTDGNAEVIYSAWIPANFTGSSDTIKYMGIDFPSSLPSAFSIKNTHLVLVYFSGYFDVNVYLLPVLNFSGAQFTYGFGSNSASASDIGITARSTNTAALSEYAISPALGNRFRYVIIPPSILATGKSSIDYSDYETVKAHYNLPD
ncbi:collagen-like protein [Maribacter polysiphoniae]|uniref:Collagen triple helix repeat protein n=1 Tax=Maribacter polysiphoniae TaxID=429344 RepID=A0A316DPX7_9FLAO|nr:collagen-like protein [Maribacter polysiphoniae]MBD1263094.1 collagen-like protein [Maribacter polysiphoniae]PWK18813.1 collagen triple helix repeat protein [Maribacter polysiphoniae]